MHFMYEQLINHHGPAAPHRMLLMTGTGVPARAIGLACWLAQVLCGCQNLQSSLLSARQAADGGWDCSFIGATGHDIAMMQAGLGHKQAASKGFECRTTACAHTSEGLSIVFCL